MTIADAEEATLRFVAADWQRHGTRRNWTFIFRICRARCDARSSDRRTNSSRWQIWQAVGARYLQM